MPSRLLCLAQSAAGRLLPGGAVRPGSAALQPARALATHHLKIKDRDGTSIAYKEIPGEVQPTILYVPGLHSYAHLSGMMSNCLLKIEDVNHVVQNLTEGPVVVVSLSMGGWLSLAAAQHYPAFAERLVGMVLYAPAVNYAYPYYQFHRDQLSEETRKRLDDGDIHLFSHAFGDALLKKDFAEDSRQYEMDFQQEIDITCPIRIIHGLDDKEVEPEQSLRLTKSLRSADVDLIYRKGGCHKAENLPDIELILNTLDRLIKHFNP